MPSLWFVVPARGRVELARICLAQLRRTCDALEREDIEATAVVIADDENLDTARELGFGIVHRNNRFVSRKFNDGIQAALDPAWNPRPADYVVPCGSDDWVDHRLFLEPPPTPHTMVGFQRASFVREDGREITARSITNIGGTGIRIYPATLMAAVGYRPADEDRRRACDTSILVNLQRVWGDQMHVVHRHLHDRQIVDWKSHGQQLNPYQALLRWRGDSAADPFVELAGVYPAEALAEMRAHYEQALVAAYRRRGTRRTSCGHEPGTTFEARLDRNAEARAIARGDIQLLRLVEPSLQAGTVTFPDGWLTDAATDNHNHARGG